MIPVTCPQCERQLAITPALAGKSVACECGASIALPDLATTGGEAGMAAGPTASSSAPPAAKRKPSPSEPGQPSGILGIFCAPAATTLGVRALWLGLLLIIASFTIKHLLVSWSLHSLGTVLEEPQLRAEQEAEDYALAAALQELEDGDLDVDYRARRKEEERIHEKRKEIEKRYREAIREARGDTLRAAASGLGKAQWMLYTKFVLDLLKIAGLVLVIFAALHIVVDPRAGTHVKVYAIVCGGATVISVLFGGLLAMLG